jgi:hypothetical protein
MAASSVVMFLMLVHHLHHRQAPCLFLRSEAFPACVVSLMKGCALFRSKQSDECGEAERGVRGTPNKINGGY